MADVVFSDVNIWMKNELLNIDVYYLMYVQQCWVGNAEMDEKKKYSQMQKSLTYDFSTHFHENHWFRNVSEMRSPYCNNELLT